MVARGFAVEGAGSHFSASVFCCLTLSRYSFSYDANSSALDLFCDDEDVDCDCELVEDSTWAAVGASSNFTATVSINCLSGGWYASLDRKSVV